VTIDLEARRAELVSLRERILGAAERVVADDEETGEITTAAGDQHLADHASVIPCRVGVHYPPSEISVQLGNKGYKSSFVGEIKWIEPENLASTLHV